MASRGRQRPHGLSVQAKLTLSYAGFLMITGGLLLAVVGLFLLRYVPDGPISADGGFIPNRSDLVRAFAPRAALAMGCLLVVSLVGGWLLAGRMLAPLTRITNATRKAAEGSLSHRIELPGRQDEFRELADAFDSMLARLESHVAEQERFASNASHELRTPLAITQAMLEVARTDPDRDVDALLERLHQVNARAITLTEALLLLSRSERGVFAREEVDLSLLVEEATETLVPLAERRGVALEARADRALTIGSPALLLQLVTNLVHNAIVHNLAERGRLRVRAAQSGQHAVLEVENTGDLIEPGAVSQLSEPFRRGTERIRGDQAGVGLGLAIVKSIVSAHDGVLTLIARPDGGLRVRVELPSR